MFEQQRVARLKQLVAELQRLPPSPARNALLYEARSRSVALDTGEERASRRPDTDTDTDTDVPPWLLRRMH
jgi:hypothetical protein